VLAAYSDEAALSDGPVAAWDEAAASVFHPAPAATDGRHPDHLPDDFHFQGFQDLFPDDFHFRDCPVDFLESRDASLPDGSPDSHCSDGPAILRDDPDDNPADRSQDGCTQADSPTSVVDS
jgi:hypothetical protein